MKGTLRSHNPHLAHRWTFLALHELTISPELDRFTLLAVYSEWILNQETSHAAGMCIDLMKIQLYLWEREKEWEWGERDFIHFPQNSYVGFSSTSECDYISSVKKKTTGVNWVKAPKSANQDLILNCSFKPHECKLQAVNKGLPDQH